SLVPAHVFRELGLFQEDFFIDYIDKDFCVRCWQAGKVVLIDKNLRFPHRIGNGDVGIANLQMPVSSPFRHYYQVRNLILSSRRNRVGIFETVTSTFRKLVKIVVLGFLAGDLRARIGYSLSGIRDGALGRGGRMT